MAWEVQKTLTLSRVLETILYFKKSYKQKESNRKVTIIYLCKSPLRHVDFFLVHFDNCITIKHTLSWNQETRVHFIVQHLSQTSSGNFYR